MIHETAVIASSARLATGVTVGPYAMIGADVEIGPDSHVGPHAVIHGPTRIGRANTIHAHACIGGAPQDLSYQGEPTRLEIGDRNTFREFTTVHRGTLKDQGVTRIGDDGLFMAYSHIGHDCVIGNRVLLANSANLSGHVTVEDRAYISGLSAIHQFVRIGRHAMIGGSSLVLMDVPPFMMASGNRARLYGLNIRGLQRAGFTGESIQALKQAYRALYRSGLELRDACARLRQDGPHSPEIASLIEFLEHSKRGALR